MTFLFTDIEGSTRRWEADARGEDYYGPALNRAARVMAAGHGGQILVAASTATLSDGVELHGVELVDLGEHRLRDLSGVHRLFEVRAEGLRAGFPALRTLDAVPGNLPVQATSFVGRAAEVAELVSLVRAHRQVTLTGAERAGARTRYATLETIRQFAEEQLAAIRRDRLSDMSRDTTRPGLSVWRARAGVLVWSNRVSPGRSFEQ